MAISSDLDCRSRSEKSCITRSRSPLPYIRSSERVSVSDRRRCRRRSRSPTSDTDSRSRSPYTRSSKRLSDRRRYKSRSRSPTSQSRPEKSGSSSSSERLPSRSRSKSPCRSESTQYQRTRKSAFDVLPEGVNLSPKPANMAVLNSAKRFHVGGLPPVDENTLAAFFNQLMKTVGANSCPGDAVVKVYINPAKKFAFIDVRTVEEASNAMALDGIMFQGVRLSIRRPTDYNPANAAMLGPCDPNPNLNLSAVGLPLHKLFVSGFPCHFAEYQVKELLETIGPLQQLNVIKDYQTGNLKGYAFCTYQNPQIAAFACLNLNGLSIGKKTLVVKPADSNSMQSISPSSNSMQSISPSSNSMQSIRPSPYLNLHMPTVRGNEPVSRVLCLTGIVPIDDLADDREYGELCQDIIDQCSKYGNILSLVIPRPSSLRTMDDARIGNAFVEYKDTQTSTYAKIALASMKFAGTPAVAVYYPEERYKILKGEMGIQNPT